MVRLLTVIILLSGLTALPARASECGQPATPVSAIQGPGDQSPMQGETVTVEGILTRDARKGTGLKGFYLQQADSATDNNPATSEALFVYTRKTAGREGDRVRVSGQVKEYHGLTELHRVSDIRSCGPAAMPEPVAVSLPWTEDNRPESLENMRVTIEQPLTIVDQYHLSRYGQVTLAKTDQWIPTQQHRPGPGIPEILAGQLKARLVLDDGQSITNPDTIHWLDHTSLPRAGDRITGSLTGILDYRFKEWRIHPDTPVNLQRDNPRPPEPERPADSNLRVMAINLENYFNGDGQGGSFRKGRGAGNPTELQRQTDKLVAAMQAPDPDIVAVMELEADGFGRHSSIAQLTEALGKPWQFVEPHKLPNDSDIRTGLLYRSDRVSTSGSPAVLELAASQGRAVLAQSFSPAGSSRHLRVIVPHLKSKSCKGASGINRDQRDGQGCWNAARTLAVTRITQWAGELPTPPGHAGNLITGDLNSYALEDPMAALEDAGFTSLTPDSGYSFRYRGRRGTLDYALADQHLNPAVVDAFYWPINADEPPALAFDGPEKTRGTGRWRASDHDPVITDIHL